MTIDRGHLRALDAAATPGPWETQWDIGEGTLEVLAGSALPGPDGDRSGSYFTTDMILEREDVWEEDDGDQHAANAELIAAARNALPVLLDEIDRLEARLAVTVPMLPVETLYRSVPIDTREHAEQIPADALLRFNPPRALVPLVAHRQQGGDMIDPATETAPSVSAYRYTTAWEETP